MSEEIKVTVVSVGQGRPLSLRWIDPATGQRKFKSAKTRKAKEAQRAAARLEEDLRNGKLATNPRMPWQDFVVKFTEQVLPSRARKTAVMFETVFNAIDRLVKPARLADMNAARLDEFSARLRAEGKAEATIKTYLAHLAGCLRWAAKLKWIPVCPEFPETLRAPKGDGAMKGRPVTGEELWKLLKATRKVVGPKVAKHWRRLIVGLWWSGLRLGEAVELRWDGIAAGLVIDISGRRPMLRIDAAHEKGNRDRLLPLAPEFCRLLQRTPEARQRGKVFSVPHPKSGRILPTDEVSALICRIGKAAGVKVRSKTRTKTDKTTGERKPVETVKFASAHDLRRSFGERWSVRVMPRVLMELMRHENINTTLKFYCGKNAERTADAAWAAYEAANAMQQARKPGPVNTFVNTAAESAPEADPRNDASPCGAKACEVGATRFELATF
jgi:integrase